VGAGGQSAGPRYLLAGSAAAEEPPAQAAFKSEKEKLSYALGMDLAGKFQAQSLDVDIDVFTRGLRDGLGGGKTLFSREELKAYVVAKQKELREKHNAARWALGEKNQKEGDAFLAENKTKEGVVALPSGLQYKVLKSGDGRKPTKHDTVVAHYRGATVDGKEFDNSFNRGKPSSLPIGRLIKGWAEAMQLMPVGSKWQLFIPPHLAYGRRGMGNTIAPNATLVFEVELLSIEEKPTSASPRP
jgi:FKBP-type peptidyl-prolyl cis-trans isomerase